MSFAELRESIRRDAAPPADAHLAVQGLWHDARGDWDGAHQAVQRNEGNRDCAWVHAYLHRKEGDLGNAGYWYSRAGRSMPANGITLETEWEQIARALLGE
jgi:hypothetical protein